MQNRIAYYILSLLYLNGRVRIPGIGRIVHHYEAAAVKDSESIITPPQSHGVFVEERQSKNRLLEKFVAYKTHSSRTRARREIARFSNQVRSGIKNEGKVELKYLGTLSLIGDALQFSPHEEILNPGYSALKRIQLPPRISAAEEIEIESTPYAAIDATVPVMEPVVQEMAGRREEITPDAHSQPAPMEFTPDLPEPEIMTPAPVLLHEKAEPIVIPVAALGKQTDNRQPSTIAVSKTSPPTIVKQKRQRSLVIPIAAIALLGLFVVAFLFYQSRISYKESTALIDTTETQDQEQPLASSDENEVADEVGHDEAQEETKVALADTGTRKESDANHAVQEENIAPTAKSGTPVSSVQESIHIATGECLVVVGAFSVAGNTERMVSRLQAMGYTTLTNPRGQLTQVGVPVDCKANNLQVVLDFLRRNVEQEAWVLRPK